MTAALDITPQAIDQQNDAENAIVPIVQLDGGWSTRTYPHLLPPNKLAVADNVVYYQDGLISKRPGNVLYGNGTGKVGSGAPVRAMARFYFGNPVAGQLVAHSSTGLYSGNDTTGAFTLITNALDGVQPAGFAQMYDPDNGTGATTLFVTDGVHAPGMWDGATWRTVNTAAGFLPTNLRTGLPIKPKYCIVWNEHLVYAGDPADPSGIWISDAFRPERFTGYTILDSAGTQYTAYYPGGQDSSLGVITGLAVLGPYLIVFRTAGTVTAVNTGTYGAFQYQFSTISSSIGTPAPASVVNFDRYVLFFGGDKFYATDGNSVEALPDEVPTVYANNAQSVQPPEIKVRSSVASVRRGRQYWSAYDSTGSGTLDKIVVFDVAAAGGFQYGISQYGVAESGGAWARWPSGMKMRCGVECRGPGDTQQLFWGSSTDDTVYQHDVGTYTDNGATILVDIRAKSFFFDRPLSSKIVQSMYVLTAMPSQGAAYTDSIVPYVVLDATQNLGSPINVTVAPQGALWGGVQWGTFQWTPNVAVQQQSPKGFLTGQNPSGLSVSPGCTENSGNPFNVFGFALVLTMEPGPQP